MQTIAIPSVFSRGVGKVRGKAYAVRDRLGMLYNNNEARYFDRQFGTDTTGKTAFQDLDVEGDSVPHGTGYQAVNANHFDAVIRSLNIPPESGFLDIGCGKGKPLLLASRHPNFSMISGVELAKSLCDVARLNAERHRKWARTSAPIEVFEADATLFPIDERVNVIFMNNPFSETLVPKVLENVRRSLAARPRRLWFLYGNPQHRDLIDRSEGFRFVKHHAFFGPGRDIRVYVAGL